MGMAGMGRTVGEQGETPQEGETQRCKGSRITETQGHRGARGLGRKLEGPEQGRQADGWVQPRGQASGCSKRVARMPCPPPAHLATDPCPACRAPWSRPPTFCHGLPEQPSHWGRVLWHIQTSPACPLCHDGVTGPRVPPWPGKVPSPAQSRDNSCFHSGATGALGPALGRSYHQTFAKLAAASSWERKGKCQAPMMCFLHQTSATPPDDGPAHCPGWEFGENSHCNRLYKDSSLSWAPDLGGCGDKSGPRVLPPRAQGLAGLRMPGPCPHSLSPSSVQAWSMHLCRCGSCPENPSLPAGRGSIHPAL